MTAEDVKELLGLKPHPREGGWYVRTWEAEEYVAARQGERRTSTAIYYLLEPGTFSEMHRLRSDEVFHHYMGGAVQMLQLAAGGEGGTVRLGGDLAAGERPQVVVPRGVWQGSRLVREEGFALLGCTVSPGFEFDDYESAPSAELSGQWPAWAEEIARLSRY